MHKDIYISASMLKDYLDCPTKVYYRLEHPELSFQNEDMTAGEIVHNTLQYFWNDRIRSNAYIMTESEKAGLDIRHIDKVNLCVSNFFDSFHTFCSDKDRIEYRFKIPVGDVFLVGKMDRILSSGVIIDWKTSALAPKNISDDPQFILYHYAYEQIFGKPPSEVLRINLQTSEVTVYKRDKVLEYSIINSVIPALIATIKSGNFPPLGLYSGKCRKCPYLEACHRELGY